MELGLLELEARVEAKLAAVPMTDKIVMALRPWQVNSRDNQDLTWAQALRPMQDSELTRKAKERGQESTALDLLHNQLLVLEWDKVSVRVPVLSVTLLAILKISKCQKKINSRPELDKREKIQSKVNQNSLIVSIEIIYTTN